jgi:hypothetical protein
MTTVSNSRTMEGRYALHVRAATAEFCGEHLVFLNTEGELAALSLVEDVESWNVISSGL